jgi:protein CMS1
MSDSEGGGGIPLIEPLSRPVSPSDAKLGKRKRDDSSHGKKAKKRTAFKKQPKDINDDDLDEELGLNLAIGRMDGQLLVDHVAQRTKRFEPELSAVEIEDRYLPGKRKSWPTALLHPVCLQSTPRPDRGVFP